MPELEKKDKQKEHSSFEQIDITKDYFEACERILDKDESLLSPNVKKKIYPRDVKKITYSPQTEAVYYYKSRNIKDLEKGRIWDLFEDRGAHVESKLIEELKTIKEIERDYRTITKEEEQLEIMKNGELVQAIIDFMKKYGSKTNRYRIDKGEEEKCRVFNFHRANLKEEIILFLTDKRLIINREEESGNVLQKAIKYMNRTVIRWYYEGLLRIKRLEDKQKIFFRKLKNYQ